MSDLMVRARQQATGLDNWAAVLEAHDPDSAAKGILMLRAAAKTLRHFADVKKWEPNYCPRCGDDVLTCPNCDQPTADVPEGPHKVFRHNTPPGPVFGVEDQFGRTRFVGNGDNAEQECANVRDALNRLHTQEKKDG